MNKRMRELQARIVEKTNEAKGFMVEGEGRDLEKAEAILNEIDALQKELEIEKRLFEAGKVEAPAAVPAEPKEEKADGFKAMTKVLAGSALSAAEKDLITGDDATAGENNLIPEDVRLAINEIKKTYVSARSIVNVVETESLSGSVNYEAGTPAGLSSFTDGGTVGEEENVAFTRKTFTIGWYGKLIPISRILLGAERAGLMSYLDRWFVKNSIVTENASIFAKLKAGYNSGTPKAVAGWKALKKSINKDLDPSCLIGGVIVTNQSGFCCLDEEVDANGRPILQPNPANPTEKLFQGLPVKVFPDAQLANIDTTHFPVIYGDTKAGCTFVEKQGLEFAVATEYLFNKNQNCLRVIEGFDTMSTDTSAYIYGSLTATPAG